VLVNLADLEQLFPIAKQCRWAMA